MAKPTFSRDKEKARLAAAELLTEPQTFAVRVLTAARPHLKQIAALGAGLVVVIVVLAIWSWWSARNAARSTLAFGTLISDSQAKVEEGGPDIQLADPNNPLPQPDKPKYKTFAERAQRVLELVPTLGLSSKVANQARLVEAGLQYDIGKYDEAIASYRAFIGGSSDAELIARAREGIGYSSEAKALAQTDAAARNAGLDQALAAFAEMAKSDRQPLYATGLYHQGRIKALKGDKAGAIELFKKALESGATPDLVQQINNRLALLEG